MAMLFIKT